MPKNRLISGMGRFAPQRRKKVFRRFIRYLQVQRIRAEIYFVAPNQLLLFAAAEALSRPFVDDARISRLSVMPVTESEWEATEDLSRRT